MKFFRGSFINTIGEYASNGFGCFSIAISIALIAGTSLFYNQFSYMQNRTLVLNADKIVFVHLHMLITTTARKVECL